MGMKRTMMIAALAAVAGRQPYREWEVAYPYVPHG